METFDSANFEEKKLIEEKNLDMQRLKDARSVTFTKLLQTCFYCQIISINMCFANYKSKKKVAENRLTPQSHFLRLGLRCRSD